ncbi:hypothetical protein ETAA8_57380 [Anatilimnocola aggregata]|uniref:AbiEi antitoxin C-terminal domain-containing protein n=1 Tax=Anatilimnocola aggregata TaxID=2528021 RepID=A0A517YK50_9BACT|nr:hypothetical protein [Anatilimnocola aggregata]QDU30592.1 hypothetical protein ETAA8_57380 [Anatilimnocola aggregata]
MPVSYKSRFLVARQDIETALDSLSSRVLTADVVTDLLNQFRENWRLGNIAPLAFLRLLEEHSHLHTVKLRFPTRPVTRLVWREASEFEIVQSLSEKGYFSHYSAIYFNGLTEQVPKIFYFNIEQAVRPGGGTLVQEAVDRVFRGKCRQSSRIASLGERSVCMVNGGNTDNLGVFPRKLAESTSEIHVTDIERTLIDAAVRPAYSGGVHQVLAAYRAASKNVSVNRLVSYLLRINYTYPYHQAIGFYMERAGYRATQIELLNEFKIEFNFHLDYGLKNPDFNSRWRLFIPKGF